MTISSFRKTIKQSWPAKVALVFFVIWSVWWISIYLRGLTEGKENDLFTVTYFWLSLWGGLWGLFSARYWGGFRSAFGRAIGLFSLGLLAQLFGQITYALYIYVFGLEPYPSLGDIGYFGSIIFYAAAVIVLGGVVGVRKGLKTLDGKTVLIFVPFVLLLVSYAVFLQGYEFDWTSPLLVFLDFGYPLGQAIYVSLAVVVVLLSRKVLGGMMKKPTMFLLFALLWQYFCDYIFLLQNYRGTWYVAGINDYMYFASYLFMTLALIHLGSTLKHSQLGNDSQ